MACGWPPFWRLPADKEKEKWHGYTTGREEENPDSPADVPVPQEP